MLDKLLNNPKPMRWLVVGIIVVFLTFISCENANAETTFELGVPATSLHFNESINFVLTERWNGKWQIGLGLVGEQVDKFGRDIRNNMFFFAQRVTRGPGKLDNLLLGVGVGYFGHETSVMGSRLNFTLSIEYNNPRKGIWPDFYVIRHFSNAGTSPPNSGQNLFNFGYSY